MCGVLCLSRGLRPAGSAPRPPASTVLASSLAASSSGPWKLLQAALGPGVREEVPAPAFSVRQPRNRRLSRRLRLSAAQGLEVGVGPTWGSLLRGPLRDRDSCVHAGGGYSPAGIGSGHTCDAVTQLGTGPASPASWWPFHRGACPHCPPLLHMAPPQHQQSSVRPGEPVWEAAGPPVACDSPRSPPPAQGAAKPPPSWPGRSRPVVATQPPSLAAASFHPGTSRVLTDRQVSLRPSVS